MEKVVNFWRHKKVLITGHTGFKGGWLSLILQYLDATVVGVALDPISPDSLFEKANASHHMIDLREDIRHPDVLLQIVQKHQPEIIFHMAAQPLVRFSYRYPQETYATNIMGTVHLLEAVRQTPSVRATINITSDKCYKNREWCWGYREQDELGGMDPYSTSKACSELITASYRKAFLSEQAIATARAGNVIGGGDWCEDRLIPDFVRSCQEKRSFAIRNPNSTRPWQHVLDPLFGYLRLAEKLYHYPHEYSDAWNFGPSYENCLPVQKMAEKLVYFWGNSASYHIAKEASYQEANFLMLDCNKARTKLSWTPSYNVDVAIEKTIDWYQACLEGRADMRKMSLDQIAEYINLQSTQYSQLLKQLKQTQKVLT